MIVGDVLTGGILLCLLGIGLAVMVAYHCGGYFGGRTRTGFVAMLSAAILSYLAIGHIQMTYRTLPLKMAFLRVATQRRPIVVVNNDDTMSRSYDFGGSLEDIVRQRDGFLWERGYIQVGGWMYRNREVEYGSLYLHVAPWKRFLGDP